MEEAYSRAGLTTALYVAISVSFCLPNAVAVSALIFVEACVRVLICCKCVGCMRVSGLMYDPDPLSALPWVVQCCLF